MSESTNKVIDEPVAEWDNEWYEEKIREQEERNFIKEISEGSEKLAKITHSYQYVTGGAIGENVNTSTFVKKDGRYYVIEEANDDFADVNEPNAYEISYEEIVSKLLEAAAHKNTYTEVYSGCCDVIDDDYVSYEVYNSQLKKEIDKSRSGEIKNER